ncbi:MAG: DUF2267 domain-containing protein [Pseudorhodoplanes sp.]|nr:MAG: DUF2267 domain-containing protein [Pseudorhodoplanes sp.]
MDELVERIVAANGLDRDVAAKAVAIILAFLVKEAPADKVRPLLEGMPGAQAAAQSGGGGSFGMGGIMGAGAALMGIGLGMGDVQSVTRTVMAYAREKAGEDAVAELVAAIPGLGQFA